jgi:hypothetical protein
MLKGALHEHSGFHDCSIEISAMSAPGADLRRAGGGLHFLEFPLTITAMANIDSWAPPELYDDNRSSGC